MNEIMKLINKVRDKYHDYVSFSYTSGFESTKKGDPKYVKYNFYMPKLNHLYFKNKKELKLKLLDLIENDYNEMSKKIQIEKVDELYEKFQYYKSEYREAKELLNKIKEWLNE